MDTESGRIAGVLRRAQTCMANEALAKARALGSGRCGGALCGASATILKEPPPNPSILLEKTVKNCFSKYQSLEGCVPESVRLARQQQRSIDLAANPLNPDTRFAEFARLFIPPCPPPPAWYYSAGEPVLQGKTCPLPNKPGNPVLPG